MPGYAYRAVDDLGKTIKGYFEAADEMELETALSQKGIYLISAKESKPKKQFQFQLGGIKRRDLITFTLHLGTVLTAGISIIEGLEDLVSQTENVKFKIVIEEVIRDIRGGLSLSDALARHPKAFSPVYVSIVRAGEATGTVDQVLNDLRDFLEWQQALSSQIKQATFYPIMVLFAVLGLVIILFTFVFPKFVEIFVKMKTPLPLSTRLLMGFSNILLTKWHLIIGTIFGCIFLLKLIIRTPKGRMFWDRFKLKIPIFGTLIHKICLSRFSHYMSTLTKAGVDITTSLSIVENVVGNVILGEAIRIARERVKTGDFLSKALADSGHFSSLVLRMIAIGEQTGNMDSTLAKVNQYYDQEVPVTIKKVFTAMEPLMLFFLAGIILSVAISLYAPILDMMSKLGSAKG